MAGTLILCDIDGVLADISQRLPYLKEKNYDAFYSVANMVEDEPMDRGIDLFRNLCKVTSILDVHLVTGRPERTRKITEMWLSYNGISFNRMYMRKDGDYRPSPDIKVELLTKIAKERQAYDSHISGYFIDDDPENVRAVCAAFPQITGITFGVGRMG